MATKSKQSASAGRVLVRQIASAAGRDKRTRAVLDALGLGRIGKEKHLPVNQSVLGMLTKVHSLVEITEGR